MSNQKMRFRKENNSYSNFGFSSILLIFIMICIVTFSVLSLLTANSDYKLTQKVADNTTNYYKAEEDAFAKVSQIDDILAEAYLASADRDSYFTSVKNKLSSLESAVYTLTDTSEGIHLHFEEKVNPSQTLEVTLLITYPTSDTDYFYQVTEWRLETEELEIDDTLNLIQ